MQIRKRVLQLLSDESLASYPLHRIDHCIGLIIAIFCFFLYYPYFFMGVDFIDQGALLTTAYALNRGAVLFRDVFTQYGPLTAFIHLFSFKLFGEKLISLQLITLFFHPIISYFLYLVARNFLSKTESIIASLIWILSAYFFFYPVAMPWSSIYSLAFSLIGIFFAYKSLIQKSRHLIYSGLFISLSFWARQSVGIPFFTAMSLFFLCFTIAGDNKQRRYYLFSFFSFLIGFGIPSLLFIYYFLIHSALKDMWIDMFLFAIDWGKKSGNNFNLMTILRNLFPPSLFGFFRIAIQIACISILTLLSIKDNKKYVYKIFIISFLSITSFSLLIPLFRLYLNIITGDPIVPLALAISNIVGLIVFIIMIVKIRRRIFRQKYAKYIFLLLISWAAWAQYFPISEPLHFFYSIPVMIILGCVEIRSMMDIFLNKFRIRLPSPVIVQHLFFLLIIFALFLPGGFPRLRNAYLKLKSADEMKYFHNPSVLHGIMEKSKLVDEVEKLTNILITAKQNYPRSNIEVIGEAPMVLTFIPNNPIPKIFANFEDWSNNLFSRNHEELLNRIKAGKSIAVVSGGFYNQAAKYAEILNYKVVFSGPYSREAVLLPIENL